MFGGLYANKERRGAVRKLTFTGPEKAALDFILLFNSRVNGMNQCSPQEGERALLTVNIQKKLLGRGRT